MTSAAARAGGWFHRLFPFLHWLPHLDRGTWRADLEAGLVGAVLILPQAIAFATLAGMPPEYGIYTSIVPVIVAALFGSSRHTLSGPNTAVCVLIASSVAPFAAAGTEAYIGYVLALTLMTGVIQFAIGVLRLGAVLDFVSRTVVAAVVLAVGLIIMVSAMSGFLGVLSNLDEPFLVRLYQFIHDVPRASLFVVTVGAVTVAAGFVARRFWRRYALLVAVLAGSFAAWLLNLAFGPATTELALLGNLSISWLPLSAPSLDLEAVPVLKELVASAFSIAFLGMMQTVFIARSLASKSGQRLDTNQEILAQGLSNLVAPFFSSFASSGSFNRSAAHYEAGTRTPVAAICAALLLGVLAFAATPLIAQMPLAAVAGALVLVGYGLVDIRETRRLLRSRHEAIVFLATLAAALALGLNAGVFTGVTLSLIVYLWLEMRSIFAQGVQKC
jgi:SulP family sulfate permease